MVPASRIRSRVPERYATVEPDGENSCVLTTRGPWSRSALVWTALLGHPMAVLGPPELVEEARSLAAQLSEAASRSEA
jgi:hypothetical protein